jgi:hypothetical protein
MPSKQTVPPVQVQPEATCPECAAVVPLVAQRWLGVHRTGSAEYSHPRAPRSRCPGSLLAIAAREARP